MLKSPLSRQRGAFSILAAGTLMMALGCLMLVLDTGRLYMEQRKLQKLADTAALESIARLNEGDCSKNPGLVQANAIDNATSNGFLINDTQSVATQCVKVNTVDGLRVPTPDASGHAVQAIATETVPASLIFRAGSMLGLSDKNEISLQAKAVAEREGGEPIAAFSIGAQLLRLENSKLIGVLLKAVGLDVNNLTILDSEGLADASITSSGLLKSLGIEASIYELKALSPQGLADLVDTQVGLLGMDKLIDLSLNVISDSVLRADLEALRLAIINNPILKDIDLHLFGAEDNPGLITLHSAPDGTVGPALDAGINLSELLGASILIGTSQRGLEIPELNVLGLAKVELGIVEPPTIAIGPVGTEAYNAQVRLYIDVDTNNLLGGILAWLTDTVLGLRVHLPIAIDVTTASAEFVSAQCTASPPAASFEISSSVLNTCVGIIPDHLKWSGSASCEADLRETELIRLLHLPILSGSTHIEGLIQPDYSTLTQGKTYTTEFNKLQLGNTVDNIVVGLLDLLGGLLRPPMYVQDEDLDYSSQQNNRLISNLATQYLETTKINSFYDVDKVTKLVLEGSIEVDPESGEQLIPPLVNEDWFIYKSIPGTWLLGASAPQYWKDGNFSQAFHAYTSIPYGLLDVVGIPTLGNGFLSCAGLLSSLLNWNNCVQHNLAKLLQDKPGGITLSSNADASSITNPNSDTVTCSGALCVLLKPVLAILKPILNGVGYLLSNILGDVLGLEPGRSDLELHDLNCAAPRLVN